MLILLMMAVMDGLTAILALFAADPQLTEKLATLDPMSLPCCSRDAADPSPIMYLLLLQLFWAGLPSPCYSNATGVPCHPYSWFLEHSMDKADIIL